MKKEEAAPDLPTSEGERVVFLQTYKLQHDFDSCTQIRRGRFPYTMFKGNQYVIVAYGAHGSNAIFAEPMRNHSTGPMLEA